MPETTSLQNGTQMRLGCRRPRQRFALWLSLVTLLGAGCGRPAPPVTSTASTLAPTSTAAIVESPTRTLAVSPLPTVTSSVPVNTPTRLATQTPAASATPELNPTSRPTLTSTPTILPATPTVTPPLPTPTTALVARVAAWEGTITLDSYGWEDALVQTLPEDPVYPYPRLNRDLVGPPVPRTYKTVMLENEYVRLTFLPELGGRLYRWLDKASGKEMFYINPVIKPTHWGVRGWWLAIGGMEWAFPTEEHGLVEWRPWRYQLVRGADWVGIRLSDQDERSGLIVEVTVTLEAGRSYLDICPQVYNPTESTQAFQFWLNGMFALSPANRPSPELHFILPGDHVIIHSTGDPGLPDPGAEISWPSYDGRDLSRYGSWHGWLGAYAHQAQYMGAYDPGSEMGVVRVIPAPGSLGTKFFGPGNLDPGIWTDDGSGYVELWSGWTPTFQDYASLPPASSVSWQERWYSVNGLGGLSYANDRAALRLEPGHDGVQVATTGRWPQLGRSQ
jgi:hypothetical protein